MYKTNYFKNINLSSLESKLTSLYSGVNSIKSESNEALDMFNSTEWEGNAKPTLTQAFSEVSSRLSSLSTKIEKFITAVKEASEISTLQDSMANDTNVDTLLSNASSIESKLSAFKENIVNMGVLTSETALFSSTSNSFSSDGFGSGLFSVNPQKFSIARDSFNDFSSVLKTNYDSMLSLQSIVSSDSYLYYAWGIICSLFDELVKKRDSMENWIENFISSINQIENSLPEIVKGVTSNSTNTYAKSHNYPSLPNYDSYVKNGRTSEIKEETKDTSSSSTSTSGGSGGYSGGGGSYTGGGSTKNTSSGSTKKASNSSYKSSNSSGPKTTYKTSNSSGTKTTTKPKTTTTYYKVNNRYKTNNRR